MPKKVRCMIKTSYLLHSIYYIKFASFFTSILLKKEKASCSRLNQINILLFIHLIERESLTYGGDLNETEIQSISRMTSN